MVQGTAHPHVKAAITAATVCSIRNAELTSPSRRNSQCMGSHSKLVKVCLKNRIPWRTALCIYLIGLAVVGFWPTPVDKPVYGTLASMLVFIHELGLPEWFDYNFIEASANVALFIPFGFLAGMAIPVQPWWKVAGLGVLASIGMELGQLLFIPTRFSSLLDFVTNTTGAVMGVAASRAIIGAAAGTSDTSN